MNLFYLAGGIGVVLALVGLWRVVAFRAADGSERRVTGTTYSQAFHKPDTPNGSPFPVRYDTSNPADARIVTFTDFWMFPLGALGVGMVCLVIAANS
jgi:hypothetical protein